MYSNTSVVSRRGQVGLFQDKTDIMITLGDSNIDK